MQQEMKGWIALDIDGTITPRVDYIPQEVIFYLKHLYEKGWRIVFITGRTFSFGYSILKFLTFPYYLAVQNGADILQMPGKKLLSRCYLPQEMIVDLEKAYTGKKEDFVIYAGYEKGDFCYYRPSHFSRELLAHLEKLKKLAPEPWQAKETFQFEKSSEFPLIKCLGSKEEMTKVLTSLKQIPSIHATMIREPLSEHLYLILVTNMNATKGHALDRIVTIEGGSGPIIAAGDDFNDVSMLERADVRIVMETAPKELLENAHIVALSASKLGIIQALDEAIKR